MSLTDTSVWKPTDVGYDLPHVTVSDIDPPDPSEDNAAETVSEEHLLSDDSTMALVVRARAGDRDAAEALLERCLPPLRRWAHGRLPAAARGKLDTGDLVQDAAMNLLRRLEYFEPRHVGAMQGYLRQSVINRIRDEVRRIGRNAPPVELPDDHPSDRTSPLESAIKAEAYDRYRLALQTLQPKDRELVVARVEVQWTVAEIADRFGIRTVDAARMAVSRAIKRLTKQLHAG
jgi:RNA polymerase sigma-70 factor (ECF subfamily)